MNQGLERGRSPQSAAAAVVDGRRSSRALRPSVKVLPEHARGHNRSLVLQQLFGAANPAPVDDVAAVSGLGGRPPSAGVAQSAARTTSELTSTESNGTDLGATAAASAAASDGAGTASTAPTLTTLASTQQSGLSRADIARQTGLTRVTVSDLVAEMVAEGLVNELGQREDARPGKPATLLELNLNAFHIIGADLSDTTTFKVALLDLSGAVLVRRETKLNGANGDEAVSILLDLIEGLLAEATCPILGIGVGTPGIVDLDGVVHNAPNLRWVDLPLQSILSARFDVPVTVANDANAAVLAEHSYGKTANDIILMQIGAGVGAGLIIDGSQVFGGGFAAGEIGHVVVGTDGGPQCACGKSGCLEAWVSVPNLTGQLASVSGSEDQRQVLVNAGERLGIALAPVVGMLNLSEIVLSGPHELIGGDFAESATNTIRQRTMTNVHGDLTLRMTALAQDIVLRGAAVLVLSGQLGVS